MGCIESSRNRENFRTSDNRTFMKLWLPPFSTMRILNPKVGTMPRKFVNKSTRTLLLVVKNRVYFDRQLKTKIKLI